MLTSKAKLSANVATTFGLATTVAASGWLRSPSPARLPPGPPAIQSAQDAGRRRLRISGLYGPTWPAGVI
jgi:hypothetical protein